MSCRARAVATRDLQGDYLGSLHGCIACKNTLRAAPEARTLFAAAFLPSFLSGGCLLAAALAAFPFLLTIPAIPQAWTCLPSPVPPQPATQHRLLAPPPLRPSSKVPAQVNRPRRLWDIREACSASVPKPGTHLADAGCYISRLALSDELGVTGDAGGGWSKHAKPWNATI